VKRERCKNGITRTRLRKKSPSIEIFQWLTDEQSREIVNNEKEMALIRQQIAEVMIYVVRLADKSDRSG
jgi:hypothetical protein